MKKFLFLFRFALLFLTIELIDYTFRPILDQLNLTPEGTILRVAMFFALGWYWNRICDFFSSKFIKNDTESKTLS